MGLNSKIIFYYYSQESLNMSFSGWKFAQNLRIKFIRKVVSGRNGVLSNRSQNRDGHAVAGDADRADDDLPTGMSLRKKSPKIWPKPYFAKIWPKRYFAKINEVQ
jgi:hypothetical protein